MSLTQNRRRPPEAHDGITLGIGLPQQHWGARMYNVVIVDDEMMSSTG